MPSSPAHAQPLPPPLAGQETQLKIVQINCMRSFGATTEIGEYMCNNTIHIALVQEPCGYFGIATPSGYSAFSAAKHHGTPYAAIIVRNDLMPMPVHDAEQKVGACVSVHWGGFDIFVASVYCYWRGDMAPYIEVMETFLRVANGRPILFGLDANATSDRWFSKGGRANNNRLANRGEDLVQFVDARQLTVLNGRSDLYTFCGRTGRRGQSDIDVTMASDSWCDRFATSWDLLAGPANGDHNIIVVNAASTQPPATAVPPLRWMTRNVDWRGYVERVQAETQHLDAQAGTIAEVVEQVQAALMLVNDEYFRRAGTPRPPKQSEWWTQALWRKRQAVRKLRRSWQKARQRGNADEEVLGQQYNRERAAYFDDIKAAKQRHWRQYVSDEGNQHPWGKLYKFCRGKRRSDPIYNIVDEDGRRATTRAEGLTTLLRSFFPPRPVDQLDIVEAPDPGDAPYTRDEVDIAVHRFGRDKAPGPDGVTASMVRKIWAAIPDKMLELLERCRAEGEFPSQWKQARLVVLLKSPDKDRTDRRSYRPICLLSVLGKTLERVMVNRLVAEHVPHPKQYGFTAGRGTEDALLKVMEESTTGPEKYLLGIFIDFRGAFDNLRWDRVLQKIGESAGDVGLWRSYFRGRSVSIDNGTLPLRYEVQRGCPQGSICGPAVWNLMMHDLLVGLEAAGSRVVAYADDLLLLVAGNTRVQLELVATQRLQIVSRWCETVGVPINERKTVQMMLRGQLAATRPPTIHVVPGVPMAFVQVAKYLGVSLGERMTFGAHLRGMAKKMADTSAQLRRVLRKEWGLQHRTVSVIYRGLYVPCMSYGALIWAGVVITPEGRKKITTAHRAALLALFPACKTVSTVAMQVLAGQMPWDLEVRRLQSFAKLRKGIALDEADLVQQDRIAGLSLKQAKAIVEDAHFDEWQQRWDDDEHGRTTQRWIADVRYGREHPWFSPSMSLVFLLTGYGSLNESLHRRNLHATALCPMCEAADEDWQHVIADCPAYAHLRDLQQWRITVLDDGTLDVRNVLQHRCSYDGITAFARAAFQLRTERVGTAQNRRPRPRNDGVE